MLVSGGWQTRGHCGCTVVVSETDLLRCVCVCVSGGRVGVKEGRQEVIMCAAVIAASVMVHLFIVA